MPIRAIRSSSSPAAAASSPRSMRNERSTGRRGPH
jgi:hypothetical protein